MLFRSVFHSRLQSGGFYFTLFGNESYKYSVHKNKFKKKDSKVFKKFFFLIEIHFLSKDRLNSLKPIHYLNFLKREKVF